MCCHVKVFHIKCQRNFFLLSLAEWSYTVSKSMSGQNDKFISWLFDDWWQLMSLAVCFFARTLNFMLTLPLFR